MAKKPPSNKNGDGKEPPDLHLVNDEDNPPPRMDEEEEMTQEQLDRVTKAFTAMLKAEAMGQEPNYDELSVPVAPEVKEAIAATSSRLGIDLTELVKRPMSFALFDQTAAGKSSNEAYRRMVLNGPYRLVGDHTPFLFSGSDAADLREPAQKDRLEAKFRRIDAELRQFDAISRDELVREFVNTILSHNFGSFSPWFTSDDFKPLPDESRELLRQLAFFYSDTRDLSQALGVANKKASVRKLDVDEVEQLVNIPKLYREARLAGLLQRMGARRIRPQALYDIILLAKALLGVFPHQMRMAIEAAAEQEGINSDLGAIGKDQVEGSKYLRNHFIAIAQGHGSFESFYTALYDYYHGMEQDMNQKIAFCAKLVQACDTLGLDIATALASSIARLTDDLTFDKF